MCIVFLSLSASPEEDGYKLIVAANRDEYFNRPAKPADFWKDYPDILSGLDLFPGKEGGTWMGMTKNGKIGILTNYRQSSAFVNPNKKGRGDLITRFLKSDDDPRTYVEKAKQAGKDYNGFNIIVGQVLSGDSSKFSYYCNQEHEPVKDLSSGVYCLSNRHLDYGWKKVILGKERFREIIQRKCSTDTKITLLLELLHDKTRHPDDKLFPGPQDTGTPDVVLEGLSAISVFMSGKHATYGTRTNTIVIVDDKNNATFVERTMEEPINVDDIQWKTKKFDFKISL